MINFTDGAASKGRLSLWQIPAENIPAEGCTEDMVFNTEKYGREIDDDNNMVVDGGRQSSAMEKAGEWALDPVTTFCVGTGGYTSPPQCDALPNEPLGTDTDLYAQVDSRPIQDITHPNIAANTFIAFIEADSPLNGMSFSEWGLKMASGKLYSRRTTKPYPKELSFAILAKWTIQH